MEILQMKQSNGQWKDSYCASHEYEGSYCRRPTQLYAAIHYVCMRHGDLLSLF